MIPFLFYLAINCRFLVFFRGRDKPPFPYGLFKSERWFFPSPMTPTLFRALLGGKPPRPPAGFLGAGAPKRREEVGRGLRRTASVASRRGGETAST